MKTLVGKLSVAAAIVSLLPLGSFAQNIASKPGLVNRGVERLTLLPGPNLLSPARNTPSMAPALLKLGDAPTFYFTPYATPLLNSTGPTYVPLFPGRASTGKPSIRAVPGNQPEPLHIVDPLRFDHSLKGPILDSRWRFEAGPRRI
jgi:hypothetical protein